MVEGPQQRRCAVQASQSRKGGKKGKERNQMKGKRERNEREQKEKQGTRRSEEIKEGRGGRMFPEITSTVLLYWDKLDFLVSAVQAYC